MMGIPKDFVLLNCTQDSKLDASSNQKLLAWIQILWLLFSLKYSSPVPPDPHSLSIWKSSVPDLKSVVRAHFYSKSSIKWLSLICHSVTQPLGKRIRAASLSVLRDSNWLLHRVVIGGEEEEIIHNSSSRQKYPFIGKSKKKPQLWSLPLTRYPVCLYWLTTSVSRELLSAAARQNSIFFQLSGACCIQSTGPRSPGNRAAQALRQLGTPVPRNGGWSLESAETGSSLEATAVANTNQLFHTLICISNF